jgi:ABC-2 type transport system permease protein
MSGFGVMLAAHFRGSYRLTAAILIMLSLIVLLIAGLLALVCALAIVPQTRSADPDASEVSRYLALILYTAALVAMGMNCIVFSSNVLVKEKAQRVFESLLAAPVGVRALWMSKTLAVFLPGLVLGEGLAVAAFLAVDLFLVMPRMGFIVSPLMIFNGLALAPILYFPVCCLVFLVGLQGNPISGNVIANVVLSTMIPLITNLAARTGLDVGSSLFAACHLALSAAVGLLVLFLQLRLAKERVVLSCRT